MCTNCEIATDFHEYRMFNPKCMHCWARSIQLVATFEITKERKKAMQREALNGAEARGFDRAKVRSMAMGPLCIAGQAEVTVSDPLKHGKRRSRGRKSFSESTRG